MKTITTLSLIGLLALNLNASTVEERLKTLEDQNELLTEEILNSKSGGFTTVQEGKSHHGLGEAASKVYYSESPLSIGGYGEMYWAKTEGKRSFADVYRFIPYFGYKFSDSIILNTELEFEHGGSEVAIEFMYLDFLFSNTYNLRVGNLLVPMGITNLRHEPTLFNTVQRPDIEKLLLPSTWHENGVLVYGAFEDIGVAYTVGMINALNLNSEHTTDLTAGKRNQWIRKGRQGSNEKAPFKPAFVGRVDYKGVNGLIVGVSEYYADASNIKTGDISGTSVNIFDVHTVYEVGGFNLKALYTQTNVSSAEKLGEDTITKASGYYVNSSYDVSSMIGVNMKLPIFAQYERYNPIEETVSGKGEFKSITNINVGFNLYPTNQVVLKADYQIKDDKNRDKKENMLSFGLGFIF